VNAKRQQFLALKWLMESADEKDDSVRIWDSLSSEVLSAFNNEVQSCVEVVFSLFFNDKIIRAVWYLKLARASYWEILICHYVKLADITHRDPVNS